MKRPDGWHKVRDLFAEANGGGYAEKTAALEDFEAGADAYEECLRKQNVTLPDIIHHYTLGKLGRLVFIEEVE